MKVAILGDGLLGRTIHALRPGWTLLGHRDTEITERASVEAGLKGVDVAINTVAFHRLFECELDPEIARAVNEGGAINVGRVCRQVYISTDYVHEDGPVEEVLPGENPRSVYGRSKLAGELATIEHKGTVVRVAALYGHHRSHKGPTFPELVLTGYTPLALPADQRFSPTYAPDAAARIVELAEDDSKSGIYHATNAGSTTWYEFGQAICELKRHKRVITPRVAHDPLRPRNSVLRSVLLPPLRHWRLALEEWARVTDRRGQCYALAGSRALRRQGPGRRLGPGAMPR